MAKIYTGIDIGTSHIKVVITSYEPGEGLRIIGVGMSSSKGMRHGYIINVRDATKSIQEAVERAASAAGVRVRSARIAIGGVGLDELHTTGEVSLTTSGGEVADRDIQRAIQESEKRASSKLTNKKIIHAIPLNYRVDGMKVMGRCVGMKGTKFAVDTLLITAFEQHVQDVIGAVEAAHVEVEDVMASPLAASLVTLSKAQKMAGVVLANIGAETVSIAIFENDIPISIKVFPIGSSDITSDLALSLKIPLTEAEQMKRGAVTNMDVPRRKIDDVISSRLKDIFGLIDAHLKSIGKQRLLPAGIVITGGGSGITTASDIAKATLRLPSQVSAFSGAATRSIAADASWAVAYGLCRWGYSTEQKNKERGMSYITENVREYLGKMFRSFLP
jgi:cell division protein FtsA